MGLPYPENFIHNIWVAIMACKVRDFVGQADAKHNVDDLSMLCNSSVEREDVEAVVAASLLITDVSCVVLTIGSHTVELKWDT